ncbi:uncharacterized protein PGRI_051730 [Penicillium griseofulvum]|uniref:Uncharacterized protein n=1 Tax=Penicillium patulum TaxID=5078 RepID=A0A135LBG3_PENPA|nr:uncharacterized protein PGRI_051730 [Penicillium griseofulvum]KXG46317.1 hypothetical protein PGRI_051730 [Penicillium griseofulvum]
MDDLSLPTDDDLLPILRQICASNPDLGRTKILNRLRNEHQWRISETRLKNLLENHGLQQIEQEPIKPKESDLPPISYPQDALAVQQKYKDESIRCFKIYSRGPYDFGVSPNSDMAIRVDIAHNRVKNAGRPKTEGDRITMATSWPMRCLFDYNWAAAEIAGVSKEDIGRQLEAEYGVNPVPFLPPAPTLAEIMDRKIKFKIASMEKLRQMLKHPEIRKLIPVDARGEPIWDEAKHGEFCVLVVKIDKGRGLEEFGPA